MKDYQLIIFDWEGTLSDKEGLILYQLAKLTNDLGLKPFDAKKARELLGLDFYELMRRLYGDILASHQILGIKDKFRQSRYLHPYDVCLFRGIKTLLKALKQEGKLLAIATGKGRESLNKELEKVKIADYFFATRTPSECLSKPAPDMLESIMDVAGVEKKHTVMVGDSPCDFEAANHAGVDCILLDIDERLDKKKMVSEGAMDVIHSVKQLHNILIH